MLPHLPSLLTENTTMRNNPGKEESGPCILRITSKDMQGYPKPTHGGLPFPTRFMKYLVITQKMVVITMSLIKPNHEKMLAPIYR